LPLIQIQGIMVTPLSSIVRIGFSAVRGFGFGCVLLSHFFDV
jgi:hypothetical protein